MKTKLKDTTRLKAAKLTLRKLVKAARAAGVHVEVGLSPNATAMPLRYPSDPPYITALIEESERVNTLGNRWVNSNIPNPVAADACFRNGWACSLAAAILRGQLHGPPDGTKRSDSKAVKQMIADWEKSKAKK